MKEKETPVENQQVLDSSKIKKDILSMLEGKLISKDIYIFIAR